MNFGRRPNCDIFINILSGVCFNTKINMEQNNFNENELINITSEDVELIEEVIAADNSEIATEESYDDLPEEIEIVGVRFRKAGKIYYFATNGIQFKAGENAIVETQRGLEYGSVAISNRYVPSKDLVLPLRSAVRLATEEDDKHHYENSVKEVEAFNVCIEKIAEHRLTMKLIDVEYTFDNNKLLFYFTNDGRVDFRELVKDLASVFRTRIEMRQIGTRDETKITGGLGVCGRPFCCHTFLGDFVQSSIKMAKEQNLSLNSAKISGACGKLMCCLRYEYDVYAEENKKTPQVDSIVETPDGDCVVIETHALSGMIKVKSIRQPDAPIKVYHRDDVVSKGITKKDINVKAESTELQDIEAELEEAEITDSTKNDKVAANQSNKPEKSSDTAQNEKPHGNDRRNRHRRGGHKKHNKGNSNS